MDPKFAKCPLSGCANFRSRTLGELDRSDRDLPAARVVLRVELDLLAFLQGGDAGALERGRMDEHVLFSAVRLNEAEALLGVVEFHGTVSHNIVLSLTACTWGLARDCRGHRPISSI